MDKQCKHSHLLYKISNLKYHYAKQEILSFHSTHVFWIEHSDSK